MSIFEHYYYTKFKKKKKFSEQAIIDCYTEDGDICKNGAFAISTFNFLKNHPSMLGKIIHTYQKIKLKLPKLVNMIKKKPLT